MVCNPRSPPKHCSCIRLFLPHTQLAVHANNGPRKVPVPIRANPVRHQNASGAIAILVLVAATDVINGSRVDLGGDFLGPGIRLPEVACTQEVDKEGELAGSVRICQLTEWIASLARAVDVLLHILNLLIDVGRLLHLVEVLDADVASRTGGIGRVIRPRRGINAPAGPAVVLLHFVKQVEAADKNHLATCLTQGRDLRPHPPPTTLLGVVVAQDTGELFVRCLASALALDRDDQGFGRVLFQEVVHLVHQVAEVLGPCQRDGEDAVHQTELFLARILGVMRLHTDVEEAHAVVQLLARAHGLATDRGWGDVVGRRVVRSRDRERGEQHIIAQIAHPGVRVGRREDGQEGLGLHIDARELELGVLGKSLHCRGLG